MKVALDKWEHFGTSIFSVMTLKAMGAGAVNLAQGFPDFDGPERVKDAAIRAIKGGMNQYAPSPGLPELRKLLSERQERRTGRRFDSDSEVTVLSGATEAIYCACQAFFRPGDEILALEPYFDSYPAAAYAAGARVVGVPLEAPHFRFDPARLEKAVSPRTKAIILNTPHNPTGRVFDREELELIRQLVLKHDLLVITDEVYEELVYAPARHVSFATLPGMDERTVTVSSTSKTFSFTGWKIGYAFGPAPLTKALRAVHQFTVFCSATPLQAGMIEALKLPESYFSELRADYGARRAELLRILNAAGFRCSAPEGTYFILADYSKHRDVPDLAFADWLTREIKVACIPLSVFYDDPQAAARTNRHVRFAFCKGMETLQAAEKNLAALKA
jgi:N-succinyldiaminopimelate aminotransferase